MRLVEVAIPGGDAALEPVHTTTDCFRVQVGLQGVLLPWNNDCILVVLQLEGKGVLLGVMSGGDANARLRLLNLLHELEVHV